MLSVRAVRKGDHDRAISYLKRVLSREPQNAHAYHLLGAIHASRGDGGRAVEMLTRAVQIAPEMIAARFELGLMLLDQGKVDRALVVWAPLETLPDEHPIFMFRRGFVSLIKGDAPAAIEELERGALLDPELGVLNQEMARIAESLRFGMEHGDKEVREPQL